MILADKIMEERKKNGWSQEELANKLGVSRQAVSKWESAGTVPDLQRILQMADLFGVSTDYLLKDELEQNEVQTFVSYETSEAQEVRRVSMEEANEYLDMKKKDAPIIANAVFMCIISPTILILLSGLTSEKSFHLKEGAAVGGGIAFLLVMVAVAVYFFITCSIRESRMEYLEKVVFETEYGVDGMVKEKRHSYESTFSRSMAIGVVLCILAAVPVILPGIVGAPDYVYCIAVSVLLVLVAIGVNMIVRVCIVKGSYDTLLQEDEYSRHEKRAKKKLDIVSSIYWCLATGIYLAWSFWTMRWDITWIIWPVAGVLYAAVAGIMRMVIGTEE